MKNPSRRKFLGSIGKLSAAALIAGTWTRFCEPHWIQRVEHQLAVPNLPDSLVGKRLVQLSDFHVGSTDVEYIASVIHQSNQLAPDMVALTGDFINHNSIDAIADVAKLMRLFSRPPLGIFACMGNHDYGPGWRQVATADLVARTIRSAGITVLRNDATEIEGVQILGLDDLWSPRFDPVKVLREVDPDRAAICLSHNPDMCDRPVWANFRGVILSGHTHGGQCKAPLFPPPLLPVHNRNYVAGFYRIDDARHLYINRGVGHTLPVRFNCRPEITVFTLAQS